MEHFTGLLTRGFSQNDRGLRGSHLPFVIQSWKWLIPYFFGHVDLPERIWEDAAQGHDRWEAEHNPREGWWPQRLEVILLGPYNFQCPFFCLNYSSFAQLVCSVVEH